MLPELRERTSEITLWPEADRLARLESLAEIYETALEELRARHDRAHALLIVRLEALQGAIKAELRYARASRHAAKQFQQRPFS
jgi:uncharacterized protein (DUF1810 family)